MALSDAERAGIARAFYAASERAMLSYRRRDRDGREWKARDYVYDSEIGGCLRKTVQNMTREAPPNPEETAGSVQAMVLGSMIHERLQAMFAASPFFLGAETPHDDEKSHGRADLWLDMPGIGRTLVEIKTISLYGWQNLGSRPKDEHVLQVHPYMRKSGCTWCVLAYYSPDADVNLLDPKVYIVEFDPKVDAEARKFVDDARRHAKAGTLPPIPPTYQPDAFPCRSVRVRDGVVFRCPWRGTCWPNAPTIVPEGARVAG